MSISKKHFNDLAQILAQNKPESTRLSDSDYFIWQAIRNELASFCARHSTRFDRQRFFDATED